MRVVAGVHRGRRLVAPAGTEVRPTSDRARQATFNRLESLDVVRDAVVLDLFAGTGALGIEALSRGAAHCTFVDNDRRAIAAIRANLEALDLTDVATVITGSGLDRITASSTTFDLALLDPPYDFDEWEALLSRLPAAVAVVESDRHIDPPPGWSELKCSTYGKATIAVLERDEMYRPS